MPVPARTPCPSGIGEGPMQAISAPYDFVPLNDWVYIPEWGKRVSHDHPFRDGLSGEIHYTIVAESPLLVGGRQEKNTNADCPNTEVHPYRLPDGTYAIPGSSQKGMLRAVIEIIGFGRMRMVDDIRPGLRDITGPHVKNSYTDKVRNKVKTGFLRAGGGGLIKTDSLLEIVPCEMARLPHKAIEAALGLEERAFFKGQSVREKYERWSKLCDRKGWNSNRLNFDLAGDDAVNLGEGKHEGFPVFTGQVSDSRQWRGKKRDFVFYDRREEDAFVVPSDTWRDFLHIHGDDTEDEGMSWPGYWRARFHAGHEIPVFYLQDRIQDRDVLRIGLAYMPKLAGDFSTLDCIAHADKAHGEAPGVGRYDLADLLFGAINGENQKDALRGRVNIETALAEGDPRPEQQPDTILNGPKPTYFPNYLEQPTDESGLRLEGGDDAQYATYIAHGQNQEPRLRGRKRYPARPDGEVAVQGLLPSQVENRKVQIRLHTLPAGTTFRGRLVFHNLKPEELGALLWAMTWGGDEGLRHGLGMGKPFGFGQVCLQLDHQASHILPNDPEAPSRALDEAEAQALMAAFEAHMEKVAKDHGRTWKDSPQRRNLLAMADPTAAECLPAGMDLRHMCLDPENGKNEFVWAKQKGFVLGDYDAVTRQRRDERRKEEEKRRREAEAQRRAEEEAAERERRRREFEALPEHEKACIRFQKDVGGFHVGEQGRLPKEEHDRLMKAIDAYKKAVEASGSPEVRREAADLIEQTFERLGWTPSGLKKNKREKLERKRREELARWREGS